MEKVIGLIGAKGAGKTTAYNIIKDLSDSVVEITLANKLKNICSEVFEIPRNSFDSHLLKEKELEDPVYLTQKLLETIYFGYSVEPKFDLHIRPHLGKIMFSPREIAQYVGTEVLRSVHPDIHCNSAISSIDQSKKLGVVTDMRFPNEFSYFDNKFNIFFTPIYIKNTKAETKASGDTHASEAYLKDLAKKSHKVDNESTIEEFKKNLTKALISLGVFR